MIKIFGVRNAPSTKLTSNFLDIEAKDARGYRISWYSPIGPTVRNLFPSITKGSLTQGSKVLGDITDYTISYFTANRMLANASFLVNYPLTIDVP